MTATEAEKKSEAKNDSAKIRRRRGKREKDGVFQQATKKKSSPTKSKKKKSKALQKHGKDSPSGGLEALIPSLIGLSILVAAVMAQRGFRGRASVAGIDLGTTNSVICVQSPSKGVGHIDCIPDSSSNNSPIVPSVVAFLEDKDRKVGPSSKTPSKLTPHPSHTLVGHAAKQRIDTHPHHTLYHAKRVLGREASDGAVRELRQEVEFAIHATDDNAVVFHVDEHQISPHQVGSYVVNHLMNLAREFLGHDNVNSAVLAVPAKFTAKQRQETALAFQNAGV
ncbi:MAG: hypothetical protein SGARI_007038, partial [Bacillariaceae sp.]